jgi:hypothetical protein
MTYRRTTHETAVEARTRIVRAYTDMVGPVPIAYTMTRGRTVPPNAARVAQLAETLDYLADVGLLPKYAPDVGIVELVNGRALYYVRNVVFGGHDRPVYADIARSLRQGRNIRYQTWTRAVRDNDDIEDVIQTHPLTGVQTVRAGYVRGSDSIIREIDGYRADDYWQIAGIMTARDVIEGKQRERDGIRAITIPAHSMTAGFLERQTNVLLASAPGYIRGWFQALVPVRESAAETARDLDPERHARAWLSMRDGSSNCVARAIRDKLTNGGVISERASGLLDKFEKDVLISGATEDDLDRLTKALKIRVRLFDLAGKLQYERLNPQGIPYYVNNRKVIDLYRHDGHVSTHEPSIPAIVHVHTYIPNEVGVVGESATASLLRIQRNVVAVINQFRPEQAQIVGSEVICAAGTVYRPISLDIALHQAAALLGHRAELIDEDENYRVVERGLAEDVLHIGGAQAYRFRAWRDAQGFLSLWKNSARVDWRNSAVEATVYRIDGLKVGFGRHIDMRAAYLNCDGLRGSGPGFEAAKRFGWPVGGRMCEASITSVMECVDLTGFIIFDQLTLSVNTPPGIAGQIGKHLARALILTIPLAIWLTEQGFILDAVPRLVRYCDKVANIEFPADRDIAVRFIGSCQYRRQHRTFFTRDSSEAQHYAAAHDSVIEPCGNGFLISWDAPNDTAKDYSHVRAYVLTYLAIAMGAAEVSLGDAVYERDTDAFIVADDADVVGILGPNWAAPNEWGVLNPKWGQFRDKESAAIQTAAVAQPDVYTWVADVCADELPAPLVQLPHSGVMLLAAIGPGGYGKTRRELYNKYPDGHNVVVLGHNNIALIRLREIEDNPHGYPCHTYHEWFRLGLSEPATWTPLAMGTSALRVNTVIMDEFPVMGAEFLSNVLPWLRRQGVRVILTGDPLGQLQEIDDCHSGRKVMTLLEQLGAKFDDEIGKIDWRARDCPKLQAAKRAAWCASDLQQRQSLQSIATTVTYSDMINVWSPEDIVLEATNRLANDIGYHLREQRDAKYADHPLRLKFKPGTADRKKYAKRKGILPMVETPDGRSVPAAIGSTIEVPAGTKIPTDSPWKIDDTSTIHSVQGRTIKAPRKIFICMDNLHSKWVTNGVYVAMSRAQRYQQLYMFWVNPPIIDTPR